MAKFKKIQEEITEVFRLREPKIRARVKGKLLFLNSTDGEDRSLSHSSLAWILRAQIGTLDKIECMVARRESRGTFELLSIARNLFENLVWLRLFRLNSEYGLVFYAHLLLQQRQNTESMIKKIETEASIFEDYEKIDCDNLDIAFSDVIERDDTSEAELDGARERHNRLTAELDMRVRRSFTLYGDAAQSNSYGYQSHILRSEVLPKHRSTLATIIAHLNRYEAVRDDLLSPMMRSRAKARWNWKERANEAGMEIQYDFLYSYTSRLLHSTPMNLITEKSLSESEKITMLDYVFVAVSDILDEIENFTFPGAANAFVIEIR